MGLVGALYAGGAAAHGKEIMEEDSCVRRIGENMVHLSAYQPQFDAERPILHRNPQGGDTYLVIDLIDLAMREMPIGMRVIKGTSETEDETVPTCVSQSYHPDGVIRARPASTRGSTRSSSPRKGCPPLRYQYPLRVQMVNYAQHIPHRGGAADRPAAADPAWLQAHEIQARAALARLAPPIGSADARTHSDSMNYMIHHSSIGDFDNVLTNS